MVQWIRQGKVRPLARWGIDGSRNYLIETHTQEWRTARELIDLFGDAYKSESSSRLY
jgi:hypothetical protein